MDLSAFPDVTDPSDFPTDSLRKLDSSLRCPICKDLYDAPVVLHCGHTFCSLCIRSVLPNKPECPICRMAAKETHLVRNSMFGETVNTWSHARAIVLELSKGSVQAPPERSSNSHRKRKFSANSPGPSQHAGPSTLLDDHRVTVGPHSETPSQRPERLKKARRLSMEDLIPSSDSEEELPNPSIKNPDVACPLCSRAVPYNSINPHMDSDCKKYIVGDDASGITKPDSKAAWGTIFKGQAKKVATVSSAQDLEIPTTRIAKVSYGLLGLSALRKLLAEAGLPTNGDKDELIARHERWIAIYNANLDRAQPKPIRELKARLKELEEIGNRSGPKKVVDEKAWTQKNSAQFISLVAAARPKPKSAENALSSRSRDSGSALPSENDIGGPSSSNIIVID